MANILLVDDDCLVRRVLKEVLRIHRHNVVEASNGQEAFDAINPDELPDLILMDYQMPLHNGVDCARRLKTLYPSLKIIMISGSFSVYDDGFLVANKHLFIDLILKPFQIKDVVSTVERALGAKPKARMNLFECCNSAPAA